MKKLILLALLMLSALSANATTLIKTVAMVNNDAVTSYQLEKNLITAMASQDSPRQMTKEEHTELRLKILNGMIEDLLVEQRIQEIGLSVSDSELDSAIEDVQRQNKLTSEQLKAALQAQGMEFTDYQKNLRKEILRYKLIAREVRSKVEVTNTEIREYFKEHEAEYLTLPTLRLGRISFPLTKDADTKAKTRLTQQAQIARQQLLDGKAFPEVLSSLTNVAEGGDMGDMVEKEMNPELQLMVKGLAVGEVNEPAEALGSIHIFQVLDRSAANAELTEETSNKIKNILTEKNSEKRFSEWKTELRKDAIVDIRI